MEETGIVVDRNDLKPLNTNQVVSETGFKYVIDSFWVKLPKTVPLSIQTKEIYAAEWMPIENLIDDHSILSKTSKDLLGAWLERHHLLD
jgi:hypothetical protein